MSEKPFIQINDLHHNYLRDTPLEVTLRDMIDEYAERQN